MVAQQKTTLRQHLRAARRGLTAAQRSAAHQQLVSQLWPLVADAVALASYLALPDEADLSALHHRWWATGRVLWLPRVVGPGQLTWHPLTATTPLIRGAYDISEPDPAVVPAQPLPANAVMLVPGVGFTRHGDRLGQGQGFYDRCLAHHQGRTIGVAYACQMIAELPVEAHDCRLQQVVFAPPDTPHAGPVTASLV